MLKSMQGFDRLQAHAGIKIAARSLAERLAHVCVFEQRLQQLHGIEPHIRVEIISGAKGAH